jgi:hypothetical protein
MGSTLVDLYGRRVDIETDIRQLKALFAMEQILVKTSEMVRKHLHILFAAHNLLRAVIANAATTLNLSPRQISFKNAVMYVRIFGEKMRYAETNSERKKLYSRLTGLLRQSKLPERKNRRSEPRMVTRRQSNFPLMRGPRNVEKKDWELFKLW